MPPTTRSSSSLFNRDPAWSDDSDSSLTDFEDSEEETEQPVHPPLPSRPHLPKPQQPQPEQAPSKPVRNTRKTTQKATEERKSSLSKDEGPLPPYNQSGPTVDQIHKWIEAGLILLEPDYQRDVVWNEVKQMNLIDSLYKNYPVPNLVFVREYRDGEYSRICIDGKQRLTSIKRFINGEIAYKDPETKKKKWFKKTAPNQRRPLVSEDWKRKFLAKTLTIYDYENITQSQERMIFQRVQLGTVLTPAERLQAVNGGCADFLREIRNRVCSTQLFSDFSEWGKSRGKNFLVLCHIVFLLRTEKLPNALPEPDKLTPWLEEPLYNAEDVRQSVLQAFSIFGRLCFHKKYGARLSTHGVSPVEFVMAIYTITIFKHDFNLAKLAEALRKLWDSGRNADAKGKNSQPTKAGASKSYVEMRNFVEKLAKLKIDINNEDPTDLVKAAAYPPLSEEEISMLKEEHALPTAKAAAKRSRSVNSAASKAGPADDATSDDDVPLTRLKNGGRQPPRKKAKLSKDPNVAKQVESDDEDGDVIPTVAKRDSVSKIGTTRKPPSAQASGSVTSKAKPASSAATRVKRASTSASSTNPPPGPVPSASLNKIPPIKIKIMPGHASASSSVPVPSADPRARRGSCSSKSAPGRSQPNTPVTRTAPLPPDFGNGGVAQGTSMGGITFTPPLVAPGTMIAPPIIAEPLNTAGTCPGITASTTTEKLKILRDRREGRCAQDWASLSMQTSPTIPAEATVAVESSKYPTPPEEGSVLNAHPAITRNTALAGPPVQQPAMSQNISQQAAAGRPRPVGSAPVHQSQAKPVSRQQQQRPESPRALTPDPVPTDPWTADVLDVLHAKKGSYDTMRFSKKIQPSRNHIGMQPNYSTPASGQEVPFTYDGSVESISAQATKLAVAQQQRQNPSLSNMAVVHDALKRPRSVYEHDTRVEPSQGVQQVKRTAYMSSSAGNLDPRPPSGSAGRLPSDSETFGFGRSNSRGFSSQGQNRNQAVLDPRLARKMQQ